MSRPPRKLVDVIRAILPEPITRRPWKVNVVDDFDSAGADIYAGVVSVHAAWLQSVYDAGLSHVTRHYPLAVGDFEDAGPRPMMGNGCLSLRNRPAIVCRAITIERSYAHGRLTGALTSGEAFIAKSRNGSDLFASRNREAAVSSVLEIIGSKAWKRRQDAHQLDGLRDDACRLVEVMGWQRPYDASDLVAASPYEALLPNADSAALRLERQQEPGQRDRLSFGRIREACLEAIPKMAGDEIHDLLFQLAFDVASLQALYTAPNRMTDEDVAALMHFK